MRKSGGDRYTIFVTFKLYLKEAWTAKDASCFSTSLMVRWVTLHNYPVAEGIDQGWGIEDGIYTGKKTMLYVKEERRLMPATVTCVLLFLSVVVADKVVQIANKMNVRPRLDR